MSQQGEHCHASHRGHASEQPSFFRPQRRVSNCLRQGGVEFRQLFAQPADVGGDRAIDGADGSSVPIALGGQHFDHLSAPRDQRHQFTGLRIRQRPRLRLDDFSEMRQHLSVDRVGLRQAARGARKVAYLARVHNRNRQARGGQLTGCCDLVAAAGFQHDTAYAQLLQDLTRAAMPR